MYIPGNKGVLVSIQTNARKCFLKPGLSEPSSKCRTFPIQENITLAKDFKLNNKGIPSNLIHIADSVKLKDLKQSRGFQGLRINKAPR